MLVDKIKCQISEHLLFYKNVIWLYLLQVAQYILPFLTFPYLTRILRPDHFAVYAYVSAFFGIIGVIVNFGFNLSGTRMVSLVRHDLRKVSRIVGQITYAKLLVAVVLFFIVCFICRFVDILRDNFFFVMLFYVNVVLNSLMPDFVFQSYEKMKSLTTRYLLVKTISVIGILLLIRTPDDLIIIPVIYIVCSFIGYRLTILSMRKIFSITIDWSATTGVIEQLKKSYIYCFSELSSSLLSGFITVIIGIVFTDKTEVSYWSIGITAISAVQSLYSPIVNSLYPHMINKCDLKFAFRLGIVFAPILIVGTVLFVILSDFIVSVIAGSEYGPATRVLILLSPILPISFYGIFIGWPILGALGQVKALTISTIISGLANVFLICFFMFFNVLSVELLCFIRCFVECLMLVLRSVALYVYLKNIYI